MAPTQTLGSFQLLPGAAAGECRYRMSGLAAGWPDQFLARSSIGVAKNVNTSAHHPHTTLQGDGWDGRTVVRQPSAERNFRPAASAPAAGLALAPTKPLVSAPAKPLQATSGKVDAG